VLELLKSHVLAGLLQLFEDVVAALLMGIGTGRAGAESDLLRELGPSALLIECRLLGLFDGRMAISPRTSEDAQADY
jgi:hypothetical protein